MKNVFDKLTVPENTSSLVTKPKPVFSLLQLFCFSLSLGIYLSQEIKTSMYYKDYVKIYGPFQVNKILHFLRYLFDKWQKVRIERLR